MEGDSRVAAAEELRIFFVSVKVLEVERNSGERSGLDFAFERRAARALPGDDD
jgi:hypothetical protein